MRVFFLLLLASGLARAEVYRCERGGEVIYTDRPCEEGAQPKKLPSLQVIPPSEIEQRMSGDYDRKTAQEKKARDQANREWVREHRAKKSDTERIRTARVQGKVASGMTPGQVRDIYGEPDTIKTRERKGVASESWTFHLNGGVQTVEFENGRVTRHSDKKSKKSKTK